MKLIDYHRAFLADVVNLKKTRLGYLNDRVDSINTALEADRTQGSKILDRIPQGSWAHETIITPGDGIEYDADFLVQIEENADWNADPQKYAKAIWDILFGHTTYETMTKRKDRCVRVVYANDCHIDVVPYVVKANGEQVIINRVTNKFEDTNPVGFTQWLHEKDVIANRNLRRVIRLLKYLRDHEMVFTLKSVLLTALVGNVVEEWRTTVDADYYKDLPTALLHVVTDLDDWLQARPTKPWLTDPSCPTTSFDHRWTDTQYLAFRTKIHELKPKIETAYYDGSTASSLLAWQAIFGSSFRAPTTATVAASAAPTPRAVQTDRAPMEHFIEEMFRVNITHRVAIDCDVTPKQPSNRGERRQLLRSRAGRVAKQNDLLFRVVGTDVPAPYDVYWKVRNRGQEAARRNQLRGEITRGKANREHPESTSWTGHHYVECYLVKDRVCVAWAHIPVYID